MKRITILGSTGSIGRSTLEVISNHSDKFDVVALAAGSNLELLLEQVKIFKPEIVAVADEVAAQELRKRVGAQHAMPPQILSGPNGIADAAAYEGSDFVLSAIVGFAGLLPTLSAIRAGKTIGLANKETLVIAGKIVMEEAMKSGVMVLPVDSEHSAIFQCIEGHSRASVRRIVLTASGGPFVGKGVDDLSRATPVDALKHPNWNMGRKITIDSATLMNKGLEVIEAHYLFGLPPERIDVLIHPQSIVHSMVEFNDRSCIAHLSTPDMKGPIAYSLSYPERLDDTIPRLDLERIEKLTFYKPDTECFPCLSYAYDALREGGTMPAVLNAANEVAVGAFLDGAIGFNDIPVIIKKTMHSHKTMQATALDSVIEADRWAREEAREVIS